MIASIHDLHASASTPDGQVYGEIADRADVRISFAPGYYDLATSEEIAWQLERLAPELFRERMRAYYRIRSEQEGHPVREPKPDPARAEYDEARASILAVGEAYDGAVRMSALGMRTWTVEISKGLHDTLDEHSFAVACGRAASALVRSQYQQIAQLKRRMFPS